MATVAVSLEPAEKELLAGLSRIDAEIADLQRRLASEQQKLARLQASRPELARRIASEKAAPDEVSKLTAAIAETETRIEGLSGLLTEKQAEQSRITTDLRAVQQERTQKVRAARLAEIKSAGTEAVTCLANALLALVEAMNTYREAKDTLVREFPNISTTGGPTADTATVGALLKSWDQELFDGAELRPIRKLLRAGWVRAGQPLEIPYLRAPK